MARQKPLAELSPAYRKRIESAIRRGLMQPGDKRSVARGHKAEGLEKLRRRVRAHILLQLAYSGTKRVVHEERIKKNVEGMSPDMLRAVLKLDGAGIKAGAHARTADEWDDFWEGEPPDDLDEASNPLWYGAL